MTTREENLKKINEELEAMSDEQLEAVAGGILYEPNSFRDSIERYLNPTKNSPPDGFPGDPYIYPFEQKPKDSEPDGPDKKREWLRYFPEPQWRIESGKLGK